MQGIDPDLALRIIRDEKNPIAFDTETTGLEYKDVVCGWVITNYEHSVYVPVRHEGGGNITQVPEWEASLAKAFHNRSLMGRPTVGHHLGFDLRMALKHGVRLWHPLEDTMINQALIYDLTKGYSLDECAKRYPQVTLKLGDELYRLLAQRFGGIPDRKQMKNYYKLEGDNPVVVDYATGDGITTLQLRDAQQEELDKYGLRKPWKLECDLLPYLARMYHRGIQIDMEYCAALLSDDDPRSINRAVEEAAKQFTPGFNVRSPTEVEQLYRANGYTDGMFDRTPTGGASFTEKWLETNDIGEAILSVRRLEKLRDSFIMPLYQTNNVNGRVHPVLNQSKSDDYGVAGARLSCSGPNLQAYPKRNKVIGKKVRPAVVPDFGELYEMDYRQQEPRFFTHYSECPILVKGYREGTVDMHDLANDIIFHGEDRDKAKRLGMGMLTMLGIKELASRVRVDEATAKSYKSKFLDDAFPEIRDFQRAVIQKFKTRGWVKDILGRVAWLEETKFAYQGVSRIIQNSGGEHMKTGLLRVNQLEDQYPDEIQVLLSIHDSTIFQTDDPRLVAQAQGLLEGVAQEPDFDLLVPIPVDVGHGKNWSEASYGSK